MTPSPAGHRSSRRRTRPSRPARRRRRRRSVPDVGRPPHEVRRGARRRNGPGRDRARATPRRRATWPHGSCRTSRRSRGSFPNSRDLARGLKDSCTYSGKLYCVPYYAGARAVIYRKDQYKAAGIKSTPKSLAAVPGRRQEADEEVREAAQLLGALLPGPQYWCRHVLRLRLRREDRRVPRTASGWAR